MGNTPCRVCSRTLDAINIQPIENSIIAAIAAKAQPFSANSVAGVYLPSQSTTLPINWNSNASMMPIPAVIIPNIRIHLRTPSVPDQTNGNSPFSGVSGADSG